jgi:hypothetical protein
MCAIPNFDAAVRKLKAIFNPQLQQHVFPFSEQIDFPFPSFQVLLNLHSNFINVFYHIS